MKTRGKAINGLATLVDLTPIVILNETNKSGILRLLGFTANHGSLRIKIEIDGEIYFNGIQQYLLSSSNTTVPLGMSIYATGNTSPTMDAYRRIFNIPFANSIKITLYHGATPLTTNVYYGAEYAIDV